MSQDFSWFAAFLELLWGSSTRWDLSLIYENVDRFLLRIFVFWCFFLSRTGFPFFRNVLRLPILRFSRPPLQKKKKIFLFNFFPSKYASLVTFLVVTGYELVSTMNQIRQFSILLFSFGWFFGNCFFLFLKDCFSLFIWHNLSGSLQSYDGFMDVFKNKKFGWLSLVVLTWCFFVFI